MLARQSRRDGVRVAMAEASQSSESTPPPRGPRSPPGGPRSPPVELVLPLPDFLDCFARPHVGRIVSGLDILTRPECGVAPDAVFTFQRRFTDPAGARLYAPTILIGLYLQDQWRITH